MTSMPHHCTRRSAGAQFATAFCGAVVSASMLLTLAGPVAAQSVARGSQALSNASGLSAFGSGLVVQGSLQGVAAGGELVVESVQRSGEVAVVVLRGASEAAKVSVQFAAGAAVVASLTVGAKVQVVADATGWSLMQAGKLLSYIANEAGAAMVHQGKHGEVRR
jgi:hypothetical protein